LLDTVHLFYKLSHKAEQLLLPLPPSQQDEAPHLPVFIYRCLNKMTINMCALDSFQQESK